MTDRSQTPIDVPATADDDTRAHTAVPGAAVATAVADGQSPPIDGGIGPAEDGQAPPSDGGIDPAEDGHAPPIAGHEPAGDRYDPPEDGWDDAVWDEEAPRETLPERPRRKLVTPATLVLAGVALVGAGFIGGVQVQKSSASDAGGGGGARAAVAGGFGGAAQGGGRGGAGAAGTGSTTGTVANVEGSKIYVTGTDGTTVEVTVGSQASVSRLSKSSAGGVHPGDSIVVTGTTGSDGTVKATGVQASANGLSLGGIGGGLGDRPGAGGGTPAGGTGSSSGGSGSSGGTGSSGGSGSSGAVDQLFGGG